ncbi:MAG TPA: secretin N-terminal domain-containing protein, partial [Longimicrobiaceae bacterium]|nr:secretin N-terminal domain-containing protein [Longimicrobiaceae bacterium]
MIRRGRSLVLTLLVLPVVAAALAAQPGGPGAGGGPGGGPGLGGAGQAGQAGQAGNVQLDFQDLDFSFVMSALAQMAGINLMYHDLPTKPVTVRTAQPVPRASLPGLIRSIAAANGVAVVEDAGFLRLIGTGTPEEPDNRQLFIYRLRHARAAVLGSTLQSLFGGTVTQGGGATLPPPLSQQLQALQGNVQVAQTPQTIIMGGAALQGNVLIVPDEVTNSLLIRATPSDWVVLEQAVQALDLRPLQVVIEVLIVEVRRDDDLDLGLSFQASRQTSQDEVSVDLSLPAPTDALSVTGIRFGSVNIEATLSALSTSGRVRILSRPVILAQNNQQARILVGTQQPFIQLSQSLPNDPTGARAEVVQYREVGTVLSILPTINEDGYVNLAVSQEVSSATAATQFGAPIISTREAETQLLARNGQTVVLGGLVDQQVQRIRSGIPLLKDIPVLGYLFGSTRETTGNSELFLFLTPYIVASDEDADVLREHIETEREMLEPYTPIVPITPPVDVRAPIIQEPIIP